MFKKQKGITLIALIITIIVLLILAGVTIAQIAGNDSAPNKAVEARQKNEQGAEFDAIKLAAVSSIAEGDYDLYVDVPTLRTGLTGLIQEDPAEVISTGATEWTVTGNTGVQYLITNRGIVTKINGLTLTDTLGIKEGKTVSLTVTKAGSAEGKEVSWDKAGNVIFVTSLTDATEVENPTTDTVFVKAGALSTSGTGSVTVSATGEEPQTCNITIGGVASAQSTVTANPTISGGTGTQADPYVMSVKETQTGTITIAVKDANENATTADSITYTSGTPAVAKLTLGETVEANSVSETNVSSSTVTVKGIAENATGSVITIAIDTVTKYVKVVVTENSIDYGRAINTSTYGDTVNYSTTITVGENDVTLNNWKKFYENDRGETYIILADYMPNSAIDTTQFTGINKFNSYAVYASDNRKQLIDAMNSSYWDALKTGKLNAGTANEKNVTATSAAGSPTLDLWQVSWNAKYPNKEETYTTNQLYKSKRTGMSGGINWGYYVSRTNNPPTTSEYSADMSGSEGYKSTSDYDTLYFPHSAQWNSTNGYWLASPSAGNADYVMFVGYSGFVYYNNYGNTHFAFRPVVCLPSSVLE